MFQVQVYDNSVVVVIRCGLFFRATNVDHHIPSMEGAPDETVAHQRVEEQLRLCVEARRRGDGDAVAAADAALDACMQDLPQRLSYTPGIAQQLAEWARLLHEQGPSSAAAIGFARAVARCTRADTAGPELRVRMAQDPAVMR